LLVNAGFYIFRQSVFDYMKPGEELVDGPFQRLIDENKLAGFRCENFWAMDTFREQQELSDRFENGDAPWVVWRQSSKH
jgi:glucose-1-phosphate cytidylyltransferase